MSELDELKDSHGSFAFPQVPLLSETEHLRCALQLCGEKWVCDFLFNTDPAHLSILTAPMLREHALSCNVNLTWSMLANVPQNGKSQHLEMSFVFVPAFNVSHTSVGFGMQENRFANMTDAEFLPMVHAPWLKHMLKDQFRFVRDDVEGTVLMMYEYPDEDYIRLEHMVHKSTTCRQRTYLRFNRNLLRACLLSAGGILTAESVRPAMTLIQAVEEFRNCPKCGCGPGTSCGCSLDLVGPEHAYDVRSMSKHMSSHVGAYGGSAVLKRLSDGKVHRELDLSCWMQVQPIMAPDLVSRMMFWAVAEQCKEIQENPLVSVMSDRAMVTSALNPAEFEGFESDVFSLNGHENDSPDTPLQSAYGPQLISALENEHSPAAAKCDEDGICDLVSMMVSARVPPLGEPECTDFRDNSAIFGCEGFTCTESQQKKGCGDRTVPSPHRVPPDQPDDLGKATEHLCLSSGAVDGQDIHSAKTGLGEKRNSPCLSRPTQHSHLLAPSPGNSGVGLQDPLGSSAASLLQEEDEELRNLRELRKKERNRASARRSNTKKKQENDARKKEHERLKALEARLRVEEKKLRSENVRLRHLVGDRGSFHIQT